MNLLPKPTEGYTTVPQRYQMKALIEKYIPTVKCILDLGFNAGHSSESFLRFFPNATVVSFDIGTHSYVKPAKEVIDRVYPGRHTLVLGDSNLTIPAFEAPCPFDVIFIDGGHHYDTVKTDIKNCKRLAHDQTLVLIDDTVRKPEWNQKYNKGPTQAWLEAISNQEIIELGFEDYAWGRGMSWGKYRFK